MLCSSAGEDRERLNVVRQLKHTSAIGCAASEEGNGPFGLADGSFAWRAVTRRVENERPDDIGVTSYTNGLSALPGRVKTPCMDCTMVSAGAVDAPQMTLT